MEFGTLVVTIAIVLSFFIQFHYMLENPWKLCRAFHYYSSRSKLRIPKSKPRLILHYPRFPYCNFKSNCSISNTFLENARGTSSTTCSLAEPNEEENLSQGTTTNLEIESLPSLMKPEIDVFAQNRSQHLSTYNLLRKKEFSNSKEVVKKSGLTDFVHKERRNSSKNAEVEYLYSRDLFFFEYRKRPELKTEGTQFESEEKRKISSRNSRQ